MAEADLGRTVHDVELGGAATAVTAGERHTCALLEGGRVRGSSAATYRSSERTSRVTTARRRPRLED